MNAVRRTVHAAFFQLALTGPIAAQTYSSFEFVEQGRYLVVLGDCIACHTVAGGRPFAGGLDLETPFGKLVTPNITPDPGTGIGSWTDEEFIAAMQAGRGRGGRRLYPAMPYPAYTKMSNDDVMAIRAYLATVPAVENRVVSNLLPFPFNIRLSMAFWNWLNFTPGRFREDPRRSAEWNRGAYIVEGPGHCGTCHTPKNVLGGDKAGRSLAGANLQGWFAPNITSDMRRGIGAWSRDDIVEYLRSGANSRTLASGPMAEAIVHSTSRMADSDLAAVATYLKELPAGDRSQEPAPISADTPQMRAGAAIYKDNCAACHRDSGKGEPRLFPTLAGNAVVQSDDPATLVRVVLEGTRAVSTPAAPTAPAMPAFGWRLDDAQIASVLTYVRNSWGNLAPPLAPLMVGRQRKTLAVPQ
jgi:mono/diheme cytochrome c family protein